MRKNNQLANFSGLEHQFWPRTEKVAINQFLLREIRKKGLKTIYWPPRFQFKRFLLKSDYCKLDFPNSLFYSWKIIISTFLWLKSDMWCERRLPFYVKKRSIISRNGDGQTVFYVPRVFLSFCVQNGKIWWKMKKKGKIEARKALFVKNYLKKGPKIGKIFNTLTLTLTLSLTLKLTLTLTLTLNLNLNLNLNYHTIFFIISIFWSKNLNLT